MSDHKTIAKNTLFLYFRMFLTMGVGLYTSRLVLEALGVVDYGIYGLVGGIVSMFTFLNAAMASSTQRYLSFDIGRNDFERLRKTFNATLNIHFLVAIIVLLLAETIGLWFLNYKLIIPPDRLYAANWVYQFSIFAVLLTIIQVPYDALLIAREHMSVYAYVSILQTVLKLIIVLILVKFDTDKLILYSILTFCVSFIIRWVHKIYCKRHFKESVYQFFYDKTYYKELLSYSGWNLFGNIAAIARSQGNNILLNIFFGPVANAAYSLTVLVQGTIVNFVSNFQTAVNPQIVKNYASGEKQIALNLIYKSSKFSFFALFILVLPFLYNINYVMNIWLHAVPKYTIGFIKLGLIASLIETISNPLISGAQATGKIKRYQVVIGGVIFLSLPVTYIVFKLTEIPNYAYWVVIANVSVILVFRIYFLNKMIGLNVNKFLKEVLGKIAIVVCIVLFSLDFLLSFLHFDSSFILFFARAFVIVIFTVLITVVIGLTKSERKFILDFLKLRVKKNS